MLLTASSTEGLGNEGTGPNLFCRMCFLNAMAEVADFGPDARHRRCALTRAGCCTIDYVIPHQSWCMLASSVSGCLQVAMYPTVRYETCVVLCQRGREESISEYSQILY